MFERPIASIVLAGIAVCIVIFGPKIFLKETPKYDFLYAWKTGPSEATTSLLFSDDVGGALTNGDFLKQGRNDGFLSEGVHVYLHQIGGESQCANRDTGY
jgi:hypothetical protein